MWQRPNTCLLIFKRVAAPCVIQGEAVAAVQHYKYVGTVLDAKLKMWCQYRCKVKAPRTDFCLCLYALSSRCLRQGGAFRLAKTSMIYGDSVSAVDLVLCMWLMYNPFVFDHCLQSKLPPRDIEVLFYSIIQTRTLWHCSDLQFQSNLDRLRLEKGQRRAGLDLQMKSSGHCLYVKKRQNDCCGLLHLWL